MLMIAAGLEKTMTTFMLMTMAVVTSHRADDADGDAGHDDDEDDYGDQPKQHYCGKSLDDGRCR